jgi:2-polyprenyl-6-hydroxyphenyl methylase/3-demethylubiquinone-9 3-methyltransferase
MHSEQLARGERFAFGENWSRFLTVLDDERIAAAKASLQKMLGMDSLDSKSFIDIGSGSGLFSLAARMLGARVHSFDYDPSSVACAQELKRRHFSGSNDWVIEEGSVLDSAYLDRLGRFDIVYSWGVLHHTGQMWHALENVAPLVAPGGKLFIAIYNTQRPWTPVWTKIKRVYNWLPGPLRIPYTALVILPIEVRSLLYSLVQGVPGRYFRSWTQYKNSARGMSRWRDIVDWVGGYPFETAKPEEIFDLYRNKGFVLEKLFTCGGGLGCNEFVFVNGAT